jgi:selenocysteine lyase/cysteine desulfurase
MIPCQRALFDLPRDVAYLNCAYIGPLLVEALDAGRAALARKARPWTIHPADFFAETERVRDLVARLIGADAEGVAVVPAASYAIATAAANLPLEPGRTVVLAADEFPSNVLPWRARAADAGAEVLVADPGPDGDVTAALLAAIDARTAVVATAHCRWTDGALIDLAAVGDAARAAGAALVLDFTQSAGAAPLDLAAVRPDFLTAAAYKWLLGPYGTGFLWVAPHRRDGRPLEEHWMGRAGSEDFTRLVALGGAYRPGARRFDMGEAPNFALLPALAVTLERLIAWDPAAIAETLAAKTAAIAARAAAIGLPPADRRPRAGHYLGLRFPDGPPPGLLDRLAARGVHVSLRGDTLRVTPHLYNDDADADCLIEALAAG